MIRRLSANASARPLSARRHKSAVDPEILNNELGLTAGIGDDNQLTVDDMDGAPPCNTTAAADGEFTVDEDGCVVAPDGTRNCNDSDGGFLRDAPGGDDAPASDEPVDEAPDAPADEPTDAPDAGGMGSEASAHTAADHAKDIATFFRQRCKSNQQALKSRPMELLNQPVMFHYKGFDVSTNVPGRGDIEIAVWFSFEVKGGNSPSTGTAIVNAFTNGRVPFPNAKELKAAGTGAINTALGGSTLTKVVVSGNAAQSLIRLGLQFDLDEAVDLKSTTVHTSMVHNPVASKAAKTTAKLKGALRSLASIVADLVDDEDEAAPESEEILIETTAAQSGPAPGSPMAAIWKDKRLKDAPPGQGGHDIVFHVEKNDKDSCIYFKSPKAKQFAENNFEAFGLLARYNMKNPGYPTDGDKLRDLLDAAVKAGFKVGRSWPQFREDIWEKEDPFEYG